MSNGVKVIGIDVFNGSAMQVQNFALSVGATFPIAVNGSATGAVWGLANSSFAIVDRDNVIQFIQNSYPNHFHARDSVAMVIVIENLLSALPIDPEPQLLPAKFEITQVVPNPFDRQTRISYSVVDNVLSNRYTVTIYDIRGREVTTLVDQVLNIGDYQTVWNGNYGNRQKAPSGIYFVVLSNENTVAHVRRIAYLRN